MEEQDMGEQNASGARRTDSFERGAFHDDYRSYKVRASSADAPDSFQVVTGASEDIVLIVSGLNSGNLKATWGPFWRSFKPNWKIWVEDSAFRVFYSGRTALPSTPPMVKFCDG
ncbi:MULTISPECIES: hypothetical protein [Glycomyces]|uniref:Uncharacterized protein n=2 Tax=Glycomyces TaxID=58113 RepID=A0A9X3PJD1_9ACTN|nr:hypothetical protein [Glycomyces lechevalierae]MDA1383962.1 hypothetical protein [Glycomyces lechevalierae]MDR7341044.1 hypothetical protein [Glycomyces lechevalierae]